MDPIRNATNPILDSLVNATLPPPSLQFRALYLRQDVLDDDSFHLRLLHGPPIIGGGMPTPKLIEPSQIVRALKFNLENKRFEVVWQEDGDSEQGSLKELISMGLIDAVIIKKSKKIVVTTATIGGI